MVTSCGTAGCLLCGSSDWDDLMRQAQDNASQFNELVTEHYAKKHLLPCPYKVPQR